MAVRYGRLGATSGCPKSKRDLEDIVAAHVAKRSPGMYRDAADARVTFVATQYPTKRDLELVASALRLIPHECYDLDKYAAADRRRRWRRS